MKSILITTSSFGKNDYLKKLEKKGFKIFLNPYKKKLNKNQLLKLLNKKNTFGIIAGTENYDEEIINNAKSLKVISRCGVGTENLPVELLKKRKIKYYTTPLAPSNAVAELTIGLMLCCLRSIPQHNQMVKKKSWEKRFGKSINESTIGLIGYGTIGKKVAKILNSFNCKILAHDITKISKPAISSSINNLLKHSDIISLHLPLNDKTENFINESKIKKMKDNVILINTSRGQLINEIHLEKSLRAKKIFSVGLDVFNEEPYSGKLINYENVILTPHIGSYETRSRKKMEYEASRNLFLVLNEKIIN